MNPFISAVDLADYREQAVDVDKALIALDAACQLVRDQLGQGVDDATGAVLLDSDGTDTLLLPELPVGDVTSVKGPGDVTLVDGVDYVVDREMGAIRTKARGRRFLPGRQIYEVTYTSGWDAEVPASIRIVALTLAARIYDQGLVASESVGGVATTYAHDESVGFTAGELRALAKHDPGRRR